MNLFGSMKARLDQDSPRAGVPLGRSTSPDRLRAVMERGRGEILQPQGPERQLEAVAWPEVAPLRRRRARYAIVWRIEGGSAGFVQVSPAGITIGRASSCDIVLSGPAVSQCQCSVRLAPDDPDAIEVEDLGSICHTRVNGALLPSHARRRLVDGDIIDIGGVALVVVCDKDW
jgi:hypothetical protein